MNVQVKTASGIHLVPIDSRLFYYRTIFLDKEITHENAIDFAKNIMELVSSDPKKEIKVIVNSPGGIIDAGMMIYDIIQTTKTPIKLYCVGCAFSMAALIFLSGKHGRFMLPNAKLMLHQPLINTCPGGSASSIKSLSDSLIKEKDKINQLIARHTGMSKKQVERATSFDHFYTAEEAVQANLADEIVDFGHIIKGGCDESR